MIVSLPSQTLSDGGSSHGRSGSSSERSKFFARKPSIKQLFDVVLHQPKNRAAKRDKEPLKPEDEVKVITTVNQSPATLEQKQVAKAIAEHLEGILEEHSSLPDFEGSQIPSISISDYVDRLIRYVDAWAGDKPDMTSTGVSAALLGIEYLDRLDVRVSSKSVHRLYMCAVLVAVKFTEDFSISNRFWAKVAGIDLMDMNRMELVMCKMLDWNLKISREDYECQQNRFSEPVF